jgi:putative FmdB family regulatory protein
MPTYEYRCKDCGDELDVVQSFHDDPLTECPSCGGTLRKKFGRVGISFRGSGFYKTDSRSSGASATSSSGSEKVEAGSGSGDSDAGSGESKTSDAKSGDSKSSGAGSGSSTSGDGGKSKEAASA